jgi:hypothetical protein
MAAFAVVASFALVTLLGVLVAWLILRNRRPKAVAGPTATFPELCAALGAVPDANSCDLVSEGESFALRFQPSGRNTASSLTVAKATPSGLGPMAGEGANPFRERPGGPVVLDHVRPILLRKETKHDRIGKALLVNREAQTGDPAFDDKVYVETDAPDSLVDRLLGDAEVRAHVLRWLDAGWTNVRFYDPGVTVALVATPAGPQKMAAASVREVLPPLGEVSAKAPRVEHVSLRRPPWTRHAWVIAGSVVLLVAGFVAALIAAQAWPTFESRPYLVCGTVGFLAWVAAIPLVGMMVRGRSDSWRTMCIALVMLGGGLPATGIGVGIGANGALDGSPVETKRLQVVELWKTSGKSTSYHVRLKHWDAWEEPVSLTIPYETYQQLRVSGGGSGFAAVMTRQGALGWPWWEQVHRARE